MDAHSIESEIRNLKDQNRDLALQVKALTLFTTACVARFQIDGDVVLSGGDTLPTAEEHSATLTLRELYSGQTAFKQCILDDIDANLDLRKQMAADDPVALQELSQVRQYTINLIRSLR